MWQCRGPRDPDLDLRIEKAATAPASSTVGAEPASSAVGTPQPTTSGLPQKGVVDRRTYTNAEVSEIMAVVPGDGPALRMTLDTAEGPIRCVLDHAAAPQTVTNLIALITGQRPWRDPDTGDLMKNVFYDNLSFHRVVEDFIIQTGNPGQKRAGGPGWTIVREEGIQGAYDKSGALGMVDAGEDSHGSQFFITTRAAKNLAGKYTPFGRCSDGKIVTRISRGEKHPPSTGSKSATRPVDPIIIRHITVTRGPDLFDSPTNATP